MITNQRTVTIKMTKGEALRLSRLVLNQIAILDTKTDIQYWRNVHDAICNAVKKLDRSEGSEAQ